MWKLPCLRQVVVASGYFDPLHYGHIEYLQRSREPAGGASESVGDFSKVASTRFTVTAAGKDLGDKLIVIVNNDTQVGLPV